MTAQNDKLVFLLETRTMNKRGRTEKTYGNGCNLASPLVRPRINRWPGIPMNRRTTPLRAPMVVDGEEAVSGGSFPVCNKGLASFVPGVVLGVDTAGVESAE